MGQHATRAKSRAPRMAFDQELSELQVCEQTLFRPGGGQANEAVQKGKDVVGIGRACERRFDLSTQLRRFLRTYIHRDHAYSLDVAPAVSSRNAQMTRPSCAADQAADRARNPSSFACIAANIG
jgi:hypothetical protein